MKKIGLVVLILICGYALSGCSKEELSTTVETPPLKVVQVEIQVLQPRNLIEEFSLPGSLEAWQDLRLAAEVPGPVELISVEEGGQVVKGQELVKIDTLTLQANQDRARAEYELHQKTFQRMKSLVEEQLVSAQDYETAFSARDVAGAVLRSTQLMLAKGRLNSPIDGLLEERFVEAGEYVGVGDPLVRIVQIDRLKVNVDVPEKDIQYLHKGAGVSIEGSDIRGGSQQALQGEVIHIPYVADPLTRTYPVRIEIDNRSGKLRPGMIVRTRFVRRHLEKVLVVPLYAVVERGGDKFVFVRNGDRAHQQQVQLGATLKADVVVKTGLQSGDEVIIKGQHLLLDNALIGVQE